MFGRNAVSVTVRVILTRYVFEVFFMEQRPPAHVTMVWSTLRNE